MADAATIETAPQRPLEVLTAPEIRRCFCVDTSGSERIPMLMELVGSLSRATSPQEIYERFRRGIRPLARYSAYIGLSTRGLKTGEFKITRFESDAPDRAGAVAAIGSLDPWKNWNALETRRGGFLGELIRAAWPELIRDLDIREDPAVGDMLAPYRSAMAIPLFDNGEPLNWAILLSRDRNAFSVKDLEDTILQANLVGGMTKTALMAQDLRKAHDRINKEVTQIAAIQRTLLPDPLPEIHGVTLAAGYTAPLGAGGDYYDLLPLDHLSDGSPDPNGRWGVVIADVAGHGPAAAVVMAMLHAILHAYPGVDGNPAEALMHANRHLCAKRIEGSFITAFYGVYDAAKRTLTYARAGHNPPIIKRGGETHRLGAVGGIPLGIDPSAMFESATERIAPGETIVFFTDGVVEAMNVRGEMFGIAGIERAIARCTGDAECSVHAIEDAVKAHEDGSRAPDDRTIVAMYATS